MKTALVSSNVQDSVNLLSGCVFATKEFKVAVAPSYSRHGDTWQTLSNIAKIGMTTVKAYTKLICGAVVACVKKLFMPLGTGDLRRKGS